MAEEARNCFASLLETGHRLLVELEDLLKTSSARQRDELVKNQPVPEHDDRPRKAPKASSLRAKEKRDDRDAREVALHGDGPAISEPNKSESTTVNVGLPHLTEADALRLAQRKRKTMSACSLGESTPARYRSKPMVVVYYDGETQNQFESVVRTIGICRNSLRKGKMSARIDSLVRVSSSSGEECLDVDAINPVKLHCYSSRLRPNRMVARADGTEAFDKADSFLDKAQALCERAAHQILRDGDCAAEIRDAKENIVHAMEIGEAELPLLQIKAEKAAEQRRAEGAVEEERKADLGTEEARSKSDGRRVSPPSNVLEVDELEVDSSTEDSEPSLSMLAPLRLGKFQMRATTRAIGGVQT